MIPQFDVRVSKIMYNNIEDSVKIPFQFEPIRGARNSYRSRLVINTGYNWDKNIDEFNNRIYNNFEKGRLVEQNLNDLIYHELAHFMTFQECETWQQFNELENVVRTEFVPGLSIYNTTSQDGAETIAEGFVAMMNKAEVPESIHKLVEKYIMRWKK